MKLVFLSNFLNHHQLPLALELKKHLGDGYHFIQTEPVEQERLDMGYAEFSGTYDFLLCPYRSEAEEEAAHKVIDAADFVIIGSAPNRYIQKRLDEKKPVIRYSERFLRTQLWRFLTPKSLKSMYKSHIQYKHNPVYMLCASAYAARDYALYGVYKDKTYKWGYLPEVKKHNIEALMNKKQGEKLSLLWAARFMKLKHPEKFLKCCLRLKEDGIPFTANIIGSGDEEKRMRKFVERHGLMEDVHFLGFVPPNQVREEMEKADIFMFNSDYRDGWGAVINEAMNSGCAVITSHAPGAGPFLIRQGKNGLIYKNNSFKDLYQKLRKVTDDADYRRKMGIAAYKTMAEIWNAENAANNLLVLMEALQKGQTPNIPTGPCSVAKPIPQRKMYRAIIKGEIK